MEQNKEKKQNRFLKWCNDHTVEILVGGLGIACLGAGVVVGVDLGRYLERDKMGKWIKSNVQVIVDRVGKTGVFSLVDRIETNLPEAMKMIDDYAEKNPGSMDASVVFYADPFIKDLVSVDKL